MRRSYWVGIRAGTKGRPSQYSQQELPRRGVASGTRDAHASSPTVAAAGFGVRGWAPGPGGWRLACLGSSLVGAMGARDPLVIGRSLNRGLVLG